MAIASYQWRSRVMSGDRELHSVITLFTLNACGAFPNYIPNLRRGNGDGDALIEDYFGLGFSYSEVSSLLCWKLSLVGAFPLRSVCVPFARKRLLRRLVVVVVAVGKQ